MTRTFALSLLGFVWVTCSPIKANNWPAFRGADQSGVSTETGLLKEWPADGPEQLWVSDQAGLGYSGFSVVGDRLFTMGCMGDKVHMICLDVTDGSVVWSTSFATDNQEGYSAGWGHGPRGTPTYDNGKLFGLGPKGVLACVDAAKGKLEWRIDIKKGFGGKSGGWGYAESPLVDGNKVIVAPGGKTSGIVALNRVDGKAIWKATAVKPGKAEYSTIVKSDINGTRQYVKFFEKDIFSVDAANGNILWTARFPEGRVAMIPTPIIHGNQLYVAAGYGTGCRAFTIDTNNYVKKIWANNHMNNHHGGVIKNGDHLYGISDGRGLVCQDWKTGEIVWQEKDRQFLAKGAVHIADNMIYALNEQNGALTLIEANPEKFVSRGRFVLSPQSKQRKPRGKVWTHPVVVNGRLFLRDQELLHCYNVKAK